MPLRNTDPGNDFPMDAHHFFMDRSPRRSEECSVRRVAKGGPVQGATVADAVKVAWMAEAATESLRRGVPVTIEEVRNA